MSSREKEKVVVTSDATAAPKRVADGLVLRAKKKKKKTVHPRRAATSSSTGSNHQPSSLSSSCVPSILRSIPANSEEDRCNKKGSSKQDEFDDDGLFGDEIDVPSDALMCLRTYTSSRSGIMSETCAYCPIFTQEVVVSVDSNIDSKNEGIGIGDDASKSTHAVPFLPKQILLHLLHDSSSEVSSRTHVEQEIKQLARSNKICMLQLHGTAITPSGGGSLGCRGDGNDDEDVAVMETAAYIAAGEMALQNYFQNQSASAKHTYKVERVCSWYTSVLLPYFAGRTWFSSGALDTFFEDAALAISRQRTSDAGKQQYSISQMKEMIQQLAHAGLLMPRRGPGGGEGYWFSLPGLGKAAKSIVDGRNNLLRRLQSSQYKEKKRSTVEQDIGRTKRQGKGKVKLEQSGKFIVLDMLSKGWVQIHKTCTGEQFVRLVE